MATSPAEAHRRDLDELVRLAQNDLQATFDRYNDPEITRDALAVVLPRLIAVYGAAAATIAAEFYDDLRDAAGAPGRFRSAPAELPDAGRAVILARWGVGPMFSATPDKVTAFAKTSGGLQRVIADAGRYTITESATADRSAVGWRRTTSGHGCDDCRSRAGMHTGPKFTSHDHCGCIAVPVFG